MADKPPYLPCVEPNDAAPAVLSEALPFAYDGRALSAAEFDVHVKSIGVFHGATPGQLVIHNTANPAASWAPYPGAVLWDSGEAGMTINGIRSKRASQLARVRDYYRSLGWNAGPHLFVDERWIWLFSPLNQIGIHAKVGNSYSTGGASYYSIGIETVGHFSNGHVWHPAQAALVRSAVQALSKRFGFRVEYHPGPKNTPQVHHKTIAFHSDYNKPECPGPSLMPGYAIPLLQAVPSSPLTTHSLPGPNGTTHACGAGFAALYAQHGGLAGLGYALMDETDAGDCTWLVCERAVLRFSALFGLELALLNEAQARGWM